jgi:hypothetical protein
MAPPNPTVFEKENVNFPTRMSVSMSTQIFHISVWSILECPQYFPNHFLRLCAIS